MRRPEIRASTRLHSLVMGDGTRVEADKFIVCAGGRARRLTFPGSEYAITHHDVWSMERLPKSVAIVGGAATGAQLATIFDAFNVQVTLMDVASKDCHR